MNWQPLLQLAQKQSSAQIAVIHHGKPAIQYSWSDEPLDVFAVQKGILAILIGMAEEKYLLEICDHVNHHLDPQWTRLSPWDEAKLTIETLMTMTTGMNDRLEAEGEIGQTWRYNNVAYQQLKRILEHHTDLSLQQLSLDWLLRPLGLKNTRWEIRPSASDQRDSHNPLISGLWSTAHDLAEIGEALRTDVLVSSSFKESLSQSGSQTNPSWGLLWWNNNANRYMLPGSERQFQGPLLPMAPQDLITTKGAGGHQLTIVPSLELVVAITRLPGSQPMANSDSLLWNTIMNIVNPGQGIPLS
jgi:CubicO group peptidase (beta-lactamase class C family)